MKFQFSLGFQSIGMEKSNNSEWDSAIDMCDIDLTGKIDSAKHNLLLKSVKDSDLITFGLIPELVGRIAVIIPMECLTLDMLLRILTEPKASLVREYQKSFELDKVNFLYFV